MIKYFIPLFFLSFSLLSQEVEQKVNFKEQAYEDDFLTPAFHKSRRDSLRAIMPRKSVAILFSSPVRNRANDVDYEYHQDPNFYYLTGLKEPNSAVMIFKDLQQINGDSVNEIVFVQEKNPWYELWHGARLGVEQAKEKLELQAVAANTALDSSLQKLAGLERVFVIEPKAMSISDSSETDQLFGLYHQVEKKLPQKEQKSEQYLEMMMAKLRQIKTEEEIVLLRKAIDITCEAQIELMKALRPSMHEYETEAIIEYVFKKNGAEYTGFPSILGSGENSCVLHYTSNRKKIFNNELLVSDVGAEYHGYTADVTRTLPSDGKFSEEERAIYELVLKAQTEGIKVAKAGNHFSEPGKVANKIIAKGLMDLGIIKEEKEVRRYFMHGTSHYLGLDVHDAGLFEELEVNNVITVEPGIYIAEGSDCDKKWWNIGVRIEDDILITENGPENLSARAPRSIEEIEKTMKEESNF